MHPPLPKAADMRKYRAYGTGSVYRQKKKLASGKTVELGRFWLAYYVKGKLVREPANTTSKTEAERILRDRLHDIDTGRIQIQPPSEQRCATCATWSAGPQGQRPGQQRQRRLRVQTPGRLLRAR